MTNGRGVGGVVSPKKAARDGGCATVVLRVERRERVAGSDATSGGGTRVDTRGRRFSFPLNLLPPVNADFFHVSAGIPPLLASLSEAFSTRENVLVEAKVKAVDTDAGRLDGCRAGADAAAPVVATGVS